MTRQGFPATGTSSIRSGTPKWRPTASRTLERLTLGLGHLGAAASGRRQARDHFRFPFNHLGIRGCLALRQYLLDDLDRALDLLVGHRFYPSAALVLPLARHQKRADLQVCRR